MVARGLLLALGLALAGCTWGWDEVDYCGPDKVCVPCASDGECVIGSSCCGKTFFCYHRNEDEFGVCSLGCPEPDPPACSCDLERRRCRFE